MKINYKTTCKILGAIVVWQTIVEYNNNRIIKHKSAQVKKLCDINMMLAHSMDRQGIELDDFERIAVESIAE